MTTALVLAGHGSHISPNTAGVVWRLVDDLRAMGVADEITAAFWKEAPSFHQVMDTLLADDITIVPVFTARGYFTQMVIPAEMSLDGPMTQRSRRILRYARTIGEHSCLSKIVRCRVEDTIEQYSIKPGQTAVALIGHGTKRSPESRDAAAEQAALLYSDKLVAEVVSVYLDDEPSILHVYTLTTAPNLIAVPYFVASGSHTTVDLPSELGLEAGQIMGKVKGRTVYYTPPVGGGELLGDIVLDLARDTGAPLYAPQIGSEWDCFPTAGRDDLIDAVQASGSLQLGQLTLTPDEVHVTGDDQKTTTLDSPASLRALVREQPFRPLPTSRDLPGGWRVEIRELSVLHAVVETVYPGAVADWAAHRRRTFRASSLAEVVARQTGMFRELSVMSHEKQSELVVDICGSCVRHPTWFHGDSPAGTLPCAEPCNVWMSRARKGIV